VVAAAEQAVAAALDGARGAARDDEGGAEFDDEPDEDMVEEDVLAAVGGDGPAVGVPAEGGDGVPAAVGGGGPAVGVPAEGGDGVPAAVGGGGPAVGVPAEGGGDGVHAAGEGEGEPEALKPEAVLYLLRRAVSHQMAVRSKCALSSLAAEIKVTVHGFRRFLSGETLSPSSNLLAACWAWAQKHAAPKAQTVRAGVQPSDYNLNLRMHAGASVCGAEFRRLQDFVALLHVGELSHHTNQRTVKALKSVLEKIDSEDSEWVVQMALLADDLSAAFDGFHSQNRDAQTGISNMCSRMFGTVLIMKVLDKRETAVAGIAQRLEKEGLKHCIKDLIAKYGYPIADIATDQCRGAAPDIRLVEGHTDVKRLMGLLPKLTRGWVQQQLGGTVDSEFASLETFATRWLDVRG
jgi:hypothetical protein